MIYPSSTHFLCGSIGFHNCLNLVSLYNGEGYVHGIFIEYWCSIDHEVSKTPPPKYPPPTVTYSQLISGIELLEEIMWEYGENNQCGNILNIVHLEKK